MGVKLSNSIKILKLDEEKIFKVSVHNNNQTFAGFLNISPKKSSIRIMTERSFSEDFWNTSVINCMGINHSFTLSQLTPKFNSSFFNLHDAEGNGQGFYEFEFDIGFLISSNCYNACSNKYNGFTIEAPIFQKWIGYTKLQHDLLGKYYENKFEFSNSNEFELKINSLGCISLFYDIQTYSSLDTFDHGIKFPPKLKVNFNSPKNIIELQDEISKFYTLMSYLMGSDFKINTIQVHTEDSYLIQSSAFFQTNSHTKEIKFPLLPLARNLSHPSDSFEELPLNLFENYYNLSKEDQSLFDKYLRYKRMQSNEEKFLGYFRLLEKITSKSKSYVDENQLTSLLKKSRSYLRHRFSRTNDEIKKFNSKIESANKQKYNTTKCITDFFEELPSDITNQLEFKKEDIVSITKLRNDITHANFYIHDDVKLYHYTKFINELLFIAFSQSKLKINLEVCIPVIFNIKNS